MTGLDRLKAAFEAFAVGRATAEEHSVIREAMAAGRVQVVTGERAAQIGRDANGVTVITGDHNVILSVGPDEVTSLLNTLAAQSRPSPNQLPADLPDFQGREKQITKLKALLTRGSGQAAVIAIGGMGGVGKSALAVRVAHLLVGETLDGRVFVNMGGATGTPFAAVQTRARGAPLTAVEVMVKVVAVLAPGMQVPDQEDAATRAYRSVLDGKRVLLLLDNAENSAQVRPLLDWRAPTTMVLVTSTITAPGLEAIDLDVMESKEAQALLRTTLGEREAPETERDLLAERCGRLPLALRVAGTYLAQNWHVSVKAYLEALADEKKRLRYLKFEDEPTLDVYAALALSGRRLAEEEPDLEARWRLLAVFPATFDTAAAAAIWETEPDDAARDLGELRRGSMVLWAADDRWRLHDLMRDVAQIPLAGQDGAALKARLEVAQERHARHKVCELQARFGRIMIDLRRHFAGVAVEGVISGNEIVPLTAWLEDIADHRYLLTDRFQDFFMREVGLALKFANGHVQEFAAEHLRLQQEFRDAMSEVFGIDRNVFPSLTVEENLELGAHVHAGDLAPRRSGPARCSRR